VVIRALGECLSNRSPGCTSLGKRVEAALPPADSPCMALLRLTDTDSDPAAPIN
jgi:hypothetical protein